MKVFALAVSVAGGIAILTVSPAARENIWVVGSSTVQPFTKAVADKVARAVGAPAPIVENTGTTRGFWSLCGGVGPLHPDATNATRRIKKSEFEVCQKNGVEIVEIAIGLDILVVAQSNAGPAMQLTLAQLFLALGQKIPGKDGGLIANPHQRWSSIDASLPDVTIDVRVLPPISGTRDALQELFLQKGAESVPALAALFRKDNALRAIVTTMRSDGPFIVIHEDQNVIARLLAAKPNSLGIFGYRFLQANRATLRGVAIDGTDPTEEHAYSGKYKGTRKFYLYIKKAHLDLVPGLDKLAAEYVSGDALGPSGYLLALGFVPLGIEDMMNTIGQINAMAPLRGDALSN
jgi:phosphate transport system substrate-binding protein